MQQCPGNYSYNLNEPINMIGRALGVGQVAPAQRAPVKNNNYETQFGGNNQRAPVRANNQEIQFRGNPSAKDLQISPTRGNNQSIPCKFGSGCKRKDCYFSHNPTNIPQTSGYQGGQITPKQKIVPCKFGDRCNNNDCTFYHEKKEKNIDKQIPCRFGSLCTQPNCEYKHVFKSVDDIKPKKDNKHIVENEAVGEVKTSSKPPSIRNEHDIFIETFMKNKKRENPKLSKLDRMILAETEWRAKQQEDEDSSSSEEDYESFVKKFMKNKKKDNPNLTTTDCMILARAEWRIQNKHQIDARESD